MFLFVMLVMVSMHKEEGQLLTVLQVKETLMLLLFLPQAHGSIQVLATTKWLQQPTEKENGNLTNMVIPVTNLHVKMGVTILN
jgi:hypothetical protein